MNALAPRLKPATHLTAALTLWGSLLGGATAATPPPTPPHIDGRAYILQDYDSGRILGEANSTNRVEPASLTKMMTTYVIEHELRQGHIQLTDMVRISERAWRQPGSRMFIEVNKQVAVEDLLKGVIVQSGNDASVALAEHTAGSEDAFAQLMNTYAKKLGMKGTHFVNATGLPHDNHYTTAQDMALLGRALIRDFPDHYPWYAIKEYTFNGIKQYNRNSLLWADKFVDGIKTGHTESAGFSLVASAKRDNMRLISVVVGTKSDNARAVENQKLLTYGFRFFETHKLYAANQALTKARIWKGTAETLPLGIAKDIYITIPRGSYKELAANMSIDSKITAPATKGAAYGTVSIKLGGQAIAERELVALDEVPEGGVWRNFVDEIKLVFE